MNSFRGTQINSAPVEVRDLNQLPDKEISLPYIETNRKSREIVPSNCIGHGGEWKNCITVETSAVLPQSEVEGKPLDSIVLPIKKMTDSPIQTEEFLLSKTGLNIDNISPNATSKSSQTYPANIVKYKDANNITNFTNKPKSINPNINTVEVNLNNLPNEKKIVNKIINNSTLKMHQQSKKKLQVKVDLNTKK